MADRRPHALMAGGIVALAAAVWMASRGSTFSGAVVAGAATMLLGWGLLLKRDA